LLLVFANQDEPLGRVAIVCIWGIVLALFGVLVVTVAGLAADPVGTGDQVMAIRAASEANSFRQLLTETKHGWWLMAQLWALKSFGMLSISSAQALSGLWMLVAALCGVVICRRWLRLSVLSCAVFVAAFGGSAEVLSWAASPHSAYMACIALGGVVLGVLLSLDKSELRPNGAHAIAAASGFALACLYSPVHGFLVGGGLVVLLFWPNQHGLRPNFWRRAILIVWLGLPALFVSLIPTLLFPHFQIGNPPSYAHPYLLETATDTTGPISFLASRSWYLLVQVFSIRYPRNISLEWQGVLMIALSFAAVVSVFVKDAPRRWRILVLVIVASLLPAAVLALISWYPFGYVRYEYYVVVPIALLPAIGTHFLWHLVRGALPWRRINAMIGWLLFGTFSVLVLASRVSTSHGAWDAAVEGRALLTNLARSLNEKPPPALIADFWSQEMCDLIKGSHVPDFVIPRPLMFSHRTLTETELKALRDVVSSHDRVVLLISWPSTQLSPYVGVIDVMNSLDFAKQRLLDSDERLTQWHAPSVE
jgi:hypothetical protein